jgi:AraC-like DNA-binding protein/tetratricopeptide (TPR) repeat protein
MDAPNLGVSRVARVSKLRHDYPDPELFRRPGGLILESGECELQSHYPPMTSLQPRTVRRALDAMHANVGHRWTIEELASLAGSSGRTLQRQFLSFLGKTPIAVLKDIRFTRARRELLQGLSGEKVMDVAVRCGFPHFGRFAVEYRRRYGETPSQTLNRQVVLAATLAAMPPLFVPSCQRLTLVFARIEAAPAHAEIASHIADDLKVALVRAGIAVMRDLRLARYHLTGAIRGSGPHLRLLLHLSDGETGRQLWADRADIPRCDDFAADEHLACRIVAALQPCLRSAAIEQALHKPRGELSPHELALRAMPGVLSLSAEGNARALELLECAMTRDPGHSLALALAAWAHLQRVVYHFTGEPRRERARGIELTQKAVSLPSDATTLAVLGNALTLLGELDAAAQVIARALALNGGSAWAWSRSGWIDVYRGDPQSAIERFKIALDLAPHDVLAFNSQIGIGCAHLFNGAYAQAAEWQERALRQNPAALWVHRTLCPSYLCAGARLQARRSLDMLRAGYPELTLCGLEPGMPPLRPAHRDRVVGALAEAGLPA